MSNKDNKLILEAMRKNIVLYAIVWDYSTGSRGDYLANGLYLLKLTKYPQLNLVASDLIEKYFKEDSKGLDLISHSSDYTFMDNMDEEQKVIIVATTPQRAKQVFLENYGADESEESWNEFVDEWKNGCEDTIIQWR